jgi:carbon starvation protein
MSLGLVGLLVLVLLVLGYTLYGRFVAAQFALDDSRVTPASEYADGVDFVPTRPFYLLGQHLSAISAAGPIVGPIAAALVFGWLPGLLWIVLGVVFIGAVHDFAALVASVRYGATSIVEIVRHNLGRRAWLAFLGFIWIALLYVIIAFVDVTAQTFLGQTEELAGTAVPFNPGGAVALASVVYLSLSIVMGLVQRRWDPPLWLTTAVFVPATLGAVWLGTQLSTVLLLGATSWQVLILAYCFVAALLPVWLLLQPRGYLGGFVLYLALGIGVVGIFLGDFEIRHDAFKTWAGGSFNEYLFPFLFVTIACGACSGFHGLVCSGTTSKQIARESHCRPIGYGGMLLEGFVALIALATVMILAPSEVGGRGPGKIYGDGLASFFTAIFGERHFVFAATFGAMAFSTFVFDTIDVATRLGRYILQELFGSRTLRSGLTATALTAGVPLLFLLAAEPGAWRTYWILFGTSNQLLAALTLLTVTVWLRRTGRRSWFTLYPMLFVMLATVSSLLLHVHEGLLALGRSGLAEATVLINALASLVLLALAAILAVEAIGVVRQPPAALLAGAQGPDLSSPGRGASNG